MDYFKLSATRWEDALMDFFGAGNAIARKIMNSARDRGIISYYFNHPYDNTLPEYDTSVPFGQEYVLQKLNYKITTILNQYPNFEKAQNAFDAATVGGKMSLKTTETGTENATNAVTDHNATSGTGTNTSTFSPINAAYEKTSDKTKTDSSATNDRTATTTDEKSANKTTTREEFRGTGSEIAAIMDDFGQKSPITKFLNALEMFLISPEEYYEIMNVEDDL